MAFKFTSKAPCAHAANDGDVEMAGAVVKGCGRKFKQGQGDTWINGVFCDGNCNYGGLGNSTITNLCERDHTEPDWISKEIAFQDFFCNDGEPFKDQHNVNVVPALTAVAAVFSDWCIVEKDLAGLIVNGNFSCVSSGYPIDGNVDLSKEVELLASLLAPDDFSLDNSLKEHYKNVLLPCHSLQQSGLFRNADVSEPAQLFAGTEDPETNLHACQRMDTLNHGLKKQSGTCGHLLQCSWRSAEWERKSGLDEAREQIIAPTDSDMSNGLDPFAGLNMHALFGKQISSASRFSFGREVVMTSPEVDSMAPSRALEEPEVTICSADRDFRVADIDMGVGSEGEHNGGEGDQIGEDFVPEGFLYALSYMSLQDLLNMERICRSLRIRIKNDVLLWQRLHIELPMSNSLTDDIFLELASRAKGQLQSLSLVDCTRITEVALEHVVLSNPRLSKLSLPGCSRISADGVVRMVEMLTHPSFLGGLSHLKQLRIRNMDGFTKEHLERLQKMVGMRMQDQSNGRKPQFYHQKHQLSFYDDDRVIDVEECPKCSNVRLVYDCTREKCQHREGLSSDECRACILCIVRCEACGGCITDNDYEETFSLDVLCSRCWLGLPKCAECNRPACGSHADHFIRTPETTFVCGECCGTFPEITGSEFRVYA